MIWEVQAPTVSPTRFAGLVPLDVLYDFDGPRIFTSHADDGALLLAYQCAETPDTSRFVVVPADRHDVLDLAEGRVALRAALAQPWVWIVDRRHDGTLTNAWSTSLRDVPDSVLPRAGVTLLPSMDGSTATKSDVPVDSRERAARLTRDAMKKAA